MNEAISQQQLALCRAGDEQAIAGLIARLMPVLRAAAARGVCPGLEFEDALQEGLIALFSAVKQFDESRGVPFESYAAACVHNAVRSAQRAAARRKHAPLNHSVPMEQAEAQQDPGQSPERAVEASERLARTMAGIATRLSPMERRGLALFLDGQPYSAIAKRLGVQEKAVDNALQRVRAKLR